MRLDAKTILSMYNQSKMQTEESIDRDRMAELNRQIEEKRMADENAWREKQYALSQQQFDMQKRSTEGEDALRRAQLAEIERRTQVKGPARDVFDPITLKYSGKRPDDPVSYEDFDKILDQSRQLYGIDSQRQIAQASSAAALARLNQAWQLQQDSRERERNIAENTFLASLPAFETIEPNYTPHNLLHPSTWFQGHSGNITPVMENLKNMTQHFEAVEAAAKNPNITGKGVNPFELDAPTSLQGIQYLTQLMNPEGSFAEGAGENDWINIGDSAGKQLYKNALNSARTLKAKLENNPFLRNLQIKAMQRR